jgi:antitoxin component YwqK of YwqJK toxin-antitoxin module
MRQSMLTILAIALVFSCTSPTSVSTPAGSTGPSGLEWSAYQIEDIPGSDSKLVILRDPSNGLIRERGQMRNGQPEGAWQFFTDEEERIPTKLVTFAAGQYNGPYMEFDPQGGLQLSAHYRNNQLHGTWGTYRFGRPQKTAHYRDGQLDGLYQEYDGRSGKLIKEANYRNGKEDGFFRFYNEAGEVTVEYEYRDGEKISGGIVE